MSGELPHRSETTAHLGSLFFLVIIRYGYKDSGVAWLKERGFEFKKICCNAGDLIVWDSRAPHYNVSPSGSITRLAVYTCYAPVSTATQEDLMKKKNAFEAGIGTSHWVGPSRNPCIVAQVQRTDDRLPLHLTSRKLCKALPSSRSDRMAPSALLIGRDLSSVLSWMSEASSSPVSLTLREALEDQTQASLLCCLHLLGLLSQDA